MEDVRGHRAHPVEPVLHGGVQAQEKVRGAALQRDRNVPAFAVAGVVAGAAGVKGEDPVVPQLLRVPLGAAVQAVLRLLRRHQAQPGPFVRRLRQAVPPDLHQKGHPQESQHAAPSTRGLRTQGVHKTQAKTRANAVLEASQVEEEKGPSGQVLKAGRS